MHFESTKTEMIQYQRKQFIHTAHVDDKSLIVIKITENQHF